MAKNKGTRPRKRRSRHLLYFPVKGKIVESVEVDQNAQGITILFQDKTALSFDVESSHVIFSELSDCKTGNWKGIKKWPAIESGVDMVKWL